MRISRKQSDTEAVAAILQILVTELLDAWGTGTLTAMSMIFTENYIVQFYILGNILMVKTLDTDHENLPLTTFPWGNCVTFLWEPEKLFQ